MQPYSWQAQRPPLDMLQLISSSSTSPFYKPICGAIRWFTPTARNSVVRMSPRTTPYYVTSLAQESSSCLTSFLGDIHMAVLDGTTIALPWIPRQGTSFCTCTFALASPGPAKAGYHESCAQTHACLGTSCDPIVQCETSSMRFYYSTLFPAHCQHVGTFSLQKKWRYLARNAYFPAPDKKMAIQAPA
jgi:hypothetical protein